MMDIACSTDNGYVMPTGVMLTSLFENNKDADITIHVLDGGLTKESKKDIEDIVYRYGKNIIFHDIDANLFKDFPMDEKYQVSHIHSMATYYRLYLTKLLPENISKVLYLDGDIIINDKLDDLWNTDVSKVAIAAAPDATNNQIVHYNQLRYPMSCGYFNAGVLLINMEYWREHNVLTDFLSLIRNHPERLASHDQDVLNYCFYDRKMFLPVKYNAMNYSFYKIMYSPLSWEFEDQILDSQEHPAIIHYAAVPKPWHKDCLHPRKKDFEYYKSMTKWKNNKEKNYWHGKSLIRHALMRFAALKGIIKVNKVPELIYVDN